MKARPILFNTDMVQAILAGRKTQTRREAKNIFAAPRFRSGWKAVRADGKSAVSTDAPAGLLGEACPFGYPGDLLYVRETFRVFDSSAECACYDHCVCSRHNGKPMYFADGFCTKDDYKWNPSIHMPRWASRLTLEITDVRVERLQEISEEDAEAEGVNRAPGGNFGTDSYSSKTAFCILWDSIYSNWNANPWVWCVEFKVHHCNVDTLLREREAA